MPLHGQDDTSAAPQPPAQADANSDAPADSASFQTFYDQLGSQGTWIQSDNYGYVWQPQIDDPNWAPYTEGHWVYTDAGWTWASDESFGWATYHYGRWVNLNGTGWVWVPGYTWAPAWVSWRYGGGYAGWAPLPPDSFVGVDYSDDGSSIGVAFHIGGDCDGFYGIGAGCYNFVPVTCLGYGNYHGYYYHRGDNYAIINRTTNVTNINVATGGGPTAGFSRVTTGGPMLAQVNAASASPVAQANLVRTSHMGAGSTVSGNRLAVYAPQVQASGSAQPANVAGTIGHAAINRGADVMRPLAVNSRLGATAATETQVQQARIAQNHAPAGAKVMTDEAAVQPVLQSPLTSMKPVAVTVAQRTYTTTPGEFQNAAHGPVVAPEQRTYPQTSEPGNAPARVYYPNSEPAVPSSSPYYQPRSATTTINSYPAPPAHTYVQPAAPSGQVHQSQGGGSGGGGSAYHSSASGGSSGAYHSGSNAQNH